MREPWHESWEQDPRTRRPADLFGRVAPAARRGAAEPRPRLAAAWASCSGGFHASTKPKPPLTQGDRVGGSPRTLVFAFCDMGTLARRRGDRANAELWFRKADRRTALTTRTAISSSARIVRPSRTARGSRGRSTDERPSATSAASTRPTSTSAYPPRPRPLPRGVAMLRTALNCIPSTSPPRSPLAYLHRVRNAFRIDSARASVPLPLCELDAVDRPPSCPRTVARTPSARPRTAGFDACDRTAAIVPEIRRVHRHLKPAHRRLARRRQVVRPHQLLRLHARVARSAAGSGRPNRASVHW